MGVDKRKLYAIIVKVRKFGAFLSPPFLLSAPRGQETIKTDVDYFIRIWRITLCLHLWQKPKPSSASGM